MRWTPLVALVLAVGMGVSLETTAYAAPLRECGTVGGPVPAYEVRAVGLSCPTARRGVRRWFSRLYAGECARFRCRVFGMTCLLSAPITRISYRVRCAGGPKRLGFTVVAD